jgi:ornithine cyclodeaminase/alanine dehydrogenase-like protein (mu-crystallin family)
MSSHLSDDRSSYFPAGSALATTLLYPPSTSNPLSILAFGAGAQIYAHVSLLLKLYASISVVRIAVRSLNSRATNLLGKLASEFAEVQFSITTIPSQDQRDLSGPSKSLRTEISNADIILCATSASDPSGLMGADEQYVKPGAHIILVGSYTKDMHEVSGVLLKRTGVSHSGASSASSASSALGTSKTPEASGPSTGSKMKIVVDSRAACLAEAGELITAGAIEEDLVEVGELVHLQEDQDQTANDGLTTKYTPNTALCQAICNHGEITVWKSVGVGVQDVAIAGYVIARAEESGLGVVVDDFNE